MELNMIHQLVIYNMSMIVGLKQQIVVEKEYVTDFWNTTQPAYALNGNIYEEYIFANAVYDIITNHDKSNPLFLVLYTTYRTSTISSTKI